MQSNPVVWFEIYVQDMARAQAFYEKVLATKLSSLADPNGEIEMMAFSMNPPPTPGASGALVKMEGMPSGGNSTIVYFTSADCAIEEARITAAGGRVFKPKMSIGPYGFITLAIDTEGNMFGLHSMS